MSVNFIIEEHKRKNVVISNLVIDWQYIKQLASQVLSANNETMLTAEFKETCRTLRQLCDTASTGTQELKAMIPSYDEND